MVDFWTKLVLAAAPIVLSGAGSLVTSTLEYKRMKSYLEIYLRVPDLRSRIYLAESIRAEAWKTNQPFINRHPTMNAIFCALFCYIYIFLTISILSQYNLYNLSSIPLIEKFEIVLFSVVAVVFGITAGRLSRIRISERSGSGDFSLNCSSVDNLPKIDKDVVNSRLKHVQELQSKLSKEEDLLKKICESYN